MTFKFELNQFVEIGISGEMGHIKSRAESCNHCNQYQIHYKSADGRAVERWFDEEDIVAVEDDEHPGQPIYAVKAEDVPEDVIIQQ
ncbi:hypothetical protein ACFFJN_11355 [Erwinia mallotivora]|uniref:hypothetical protein n=1 Tax=Erwinia mallotivora TaxID=69222 RepID=UPI0035EBF8F3